MAERPDWVDRHQWPASTGQVKELLDYVAGLAAELAGARDEELLQAYASLRRDLRDLLYKRGVFTNPGWGDDEIVAALARLGDGS